MSGCMQLLHIAVACMSAELTIWLPHGHPIMILRTMLVSTRQEELVNHNISLVLGVRSRTLEQLARCMGTRVVSNIETLTAAHVGVCKEFKVEPLQPAAGVQVQAAGAGAGNATPLGLGTGLPAAGMTRNSSFSSTASAAGQAQVQVQSQGAAVALGAGTSGAGGASGQPPPSTQPAAAGQTQAPGSQPDQKQPKSIMSFTCATPVAATILLRGASAGQLTRIKSVTKFAIYAAYALRLETALLADHMTAALACMGSEGGGMVQ